MKKCAAIFVILVIVIGICIPLNGSAQENEELNWLVFGDSVSVVSSKSMSTYVENKYYNIIDSETNLCASALNKSAGGSTIGGTGFMRVSSYGEDAYWQRINNLPDNDYDVITVMGGFNDYIYYGKPVFGTVGDTSSDTFCGCVDLTIKLLKAKFPQAQIVLISEYYSPARPYKSQTAINEVLRSYSQMNGCGFIDLLTSTYSSTQSDVQIPTFDNTHANADGHKQIANLILPEMINLNNLITLNNQSGKCGDTATYSFDINTNTLYINGTGHTYNLASAEEQPWYLFSDNIEEMVVNPGITGLGKYMMRECRSLKKILLPESLTYLASAVFFGCSSLDNVVIPSSQKTLSYALFIGCTSLKNIYIPPTVTSFRPCVFNDCDIESLIIYSTLNCTAADYCKEKKIKLCYADVNKDFEVNLIDITDASRAIAGWLGYNEKSLLIDADNNGKKTMLDLVLISRAVAEFEI